MQRTTDSRVSTQSILSNPLILSMHSNQRDSDSDLDFEHEAMAVAQLLALLALLVNLLRTEVVAFKDTIIVEQDYV